MRSTCRPSWARAVAEAARCAPGARALRIALAALPLLACPAPAAAATLTIEIDALKFAPPSVTVKRGDSVVWVNRDLVPHTATAGKVFDSGVIAPGKSWTTIAKTPGRHDYVCSLHPT